MIGQSRLMAISVANKRHSKVIEPFDPNIHPCWRVPVTWRQPWVSGENEFSIQPCSQTVESCSTSGLLARLGTGEAPGQLDGCYWHGNTIIVGWSREYL